MISGAPNRAIASLSASTQKSGVIVFETRNDSTLRLPTSRIATKYKNPCAIGKYVRSLAQTWFARSIRRPPQQIRVDQRVARRNTGARSAVNGLDAHAAHQGHQVHSADLKSLTYELLGEPACTIKRMLQMQLIDPAHQNQVLFAHRTRRVVEDPREKDATRHRGHDP